MKKNSTLHDVWLAVLRVATGALWLNEVFIGEDWKIGLPWSGAHPGWIGPGAGQFILGHAQRAIDSGIWNWYTWLLQTLVIPYAAFWSYLIVTAQVLAGLALVLGLLSRYASLGTILLTSTIILIGSTPNATALLMLGIVIFATDASRQYSLDVWLRAHCPSTALQRWLGLLPFRYRWSAALAVVAGTLGLIAIQQIGNRLSFTASLVAYDLALVLGIATLILFKIAAGSEIRQSWLEGLRIFIGVRFLDEIFTRTIPGIERLPAIGSGYYYTDLFTEMQGFNHWPWVNAVWRTALEPFPELWVWVFGIVQFTIGCCLIWGIFTRPALRAAVAYLGILFLLGFVRFTQFFLLPTVVALAAGAGASLSLDALLNKANRPAGLFSRREQWALRICLGIALLSSLSLLISGLEPSGYESNLAGLMGSLVAIFAVVLAVGLHWQTRLSR